jgi:thiamine pyrophosphokinase
MKMKVLIVTGGERPEKGLLKEKAGSASMIIAADRGAGYCLNAGIIPDMVVGDMDSLTAEVQDELISKKVEIRRYDCRKDMTDTQIAVDAAMEKKADEIEILGGIGSRFDHSLANVHLLLRAMKQGVEAKIITGLHEIFLIKGKAFIMNEAGAIISFLPLGHHAKGITFKGFEYEADRIDMDMSFPLGVSNVICSDSAEVIVTDGILIAIITRSGE